MESKGAAEEAFLLVVQKGKSSLIRKGFCSI
jgi:hypothetical protein